MAPLLCPGRRTQSRSRSGFRHHAAVALPVTEASRKRCKGTRAPQSRSRPTTSRATADALPSPRRPRSFRPLHGPRETLAPTRTIARGSLCSPVQAGRYRPSPNNPQCLGPVLLGGFVPHRSELHGRRLAPARENRPVRNGRLEAKGIADLAILLGGPSIRDPRCVGRRIRRSIATELLVRVRPLRLRITPT